MSLENTAKNPPGQINKPDRLGETNHTLIQAVRDAETGQKAAATETAVDAAAALYLTDPLAAEKMLSEIKAAAYSWITAGTINGLYRDAKQRLAESLPYYYVKDGWLWHGYGQDATVILRKGYAIFTKMIHREDGENSELWLELEIRLATGRVFTTKIRAEAAKGASELRSAIAGRVGPLVSLDAKQDQFLVAAVETISLPNLTETTEIVRTGWLETDSGLAFCTPGHAVGELPQGVTAIAPDHLKSLNSFAVFDAGDDSFHKGIDGIDELLKAFDVTITYPLLAYTVLPVAARWMPNHKFALHISGETGSLKTATSKLLMSFYGNFADAPALQSWRSTVNSIEQTGFWFPDVLGLVDDYKPSITNSRSFAELIQRYADGNDRSRMKADGELRSRQAMRWWLLSTGEDLPSGEASVLARMVAVRFPRRPQGSPYNAALARAHLAAPHLPTVTARWAAWLAGGGIKWDVAQKMKSLQEALAHRLQANAPETPNVNRIAKNIAALQTVWAAWCEFLADSVTNESDKQRYLARITEFDAFTLPLATQIARHATEEKPTRVFLGAVEDVINSGKFQLLHKSEDMKPAEKYAGYHDENGIYLLPAMYHEIAKWRREAGQPLSFSRGELYRGLDEGGFLAKKGAQQTTVTVRFGSPLNSLCKAVLHLRPGALTVGVLQQDCEAEP